MADEPETRLDRMERAAVRERFGRVEDVDNAGKTSPLADRDEEGDAAVVLDLG